MAAYAALLSLLHMIKPLQRQNPRPPISLDKKQAYSLTGNITFLQKFLEGYSSSGSEEEDDLESRIADAAYAVEDVIETHIVDQIHVGSTSHGKRISSVDFHQSLQKVTQDMDLIKKEVMKIIKEKMGAQDQLRRNSTVSTGSVRPAFMAQNSAMMVFDDVLDEVMDKLIGRQHNLQIIQIVGMGGIGKTTLARNIYANPLIVKHFDILTWVTISQEYSRREVLQVLCQENKWRVNDLSQMSEDELGEIVYKNLWDRRYLIVMDDIWSNEVWDKIKSFFPNNHNESRIMITTRLSNLVFKLSGSYNFQMKLLDGDKSWNLLRENVFGKEVCPVEVEEIGKEIAKNCRGLPLLIVVIGGLLTRSKMTRGYWEYTLENLNSLINLENNEHCLQILHTSYKELPIHLKPCFLYMGVFPEDSEIDVSELIKLWVAEGFLKPIDGKSLEVVGKEYLKELIDRNLILVHKLGSNGKVKLCKIHDLLRDLCLREAKKQRFLCVLSQQQHLNIPTLSIQRRICIRQDTPKEYSSRILHDLESASLTRSLLLTRGFHKPLPSFNFRLLRVYSRVDTSSDFFRKSTSIEAAFQQVNLRYLSIEADSVPLFRFPSSLSLFWNLQTLKVVSRTWQPVIAYGIWKMSQLRHVMFRTPELPDPSCREDIALENLQTLSCIHNFKCGEDVVKRIPNIKELQLNYHIHEKEQLPKYCYKNLCHLQKLESLKLNFDLVSDPEILGSHLVENLTLPHSLKKLTLWETNLHWDDLTIKIGSLPFLEVLKLKWSCLGPKWETVEGQFYSLKFLLIEGCHNLKYWMTNNTHFPLLERLILLYLPQLKEIPSSIGDIATLQSIELDDCSDSAGESAKRIKEEQEELGNVDLKVQVLNSKNVVFYSDDEEDQVVSNEED